MGDVCRLCLGSGAIDNIFQNEGFLASRILLCCRLRPQTDDGLPSVICVSCQTNLNDFWRFQRLCHQSDRKLRTYNAEECSNFVKIESESLAYEFEQFEEDQVDTNVFTDQIKAELNEIEGDGVKIELEATASRVRRRQSKRYECDVCRKKFFSKSRVESHIRSKHSRKEKAGSTVCPICGKNLSARSMFNHLKLHQSDPIPCNKCDKTFTTAYKLNRHMLTHGVKVPRSPKVPCDECDKSFTSRKGLRGHKRIIHMRAYQTQCVICLKYLSNKKSYADHLKIHTGEKNFECDVCGKKFIRKPSLEDHIRMHDNIRPFACTYCDRSFTKSDYLTEHMRLHTGARPFQCPTCGKGFAQKGNMKSHIKYNHKELV